LKKPRKEKLRSNNLETSQVFMKTTGTDSPFKSDFAIKF
jgi:hypothetical protein